MKKAFLADLKRWFAFIWTLVCLYISLGMVIISFSAIQFQTEVEEDSAKDPAIIYDTPSSSGSLLVVTVAQVQLNRTHYDKIQARLADLEQRASQIKALSVGQFSETTNALADQINAIAPLLVPNFDRSQPGVVDAIKTKCQDPALDVKSRQPCSDFSKSLTRASTSAEMPNTIELKTAVGETVAWIKNFENSPRFGLSENLISYEHFVSHIFFWMPSDVLLPALPHSVLVLIVTISMGALGSVLFIIQIYVAGFDKSSDRALAADLPVSWYIFRPLQGMAVALAIFLLVKAGQISVSRNADVSSTSDLNAFVLGFLGVVSGLMSDRAMERLSFAGIELLKTTSPNDTQRNSAQRMGAAPHNPEREDLSATAEDPAVAAQAYEFSDSEGVKKLS